MYENGKPEGKYVPQQFEGVRGKAAGLHGPGPYPVSVTVYDRRGAVLLRASARAVGMEKFAPNGVVCGPTCFGAELRLNVGKHMLESLPRDQTG